MKARVAFQSSIFLLVLLSATFFTFYIYKAVGLDNLRQFILDAGIWGPIIYVAVQTITHIIAPISGSPIFLLGLAIFGKDIFLYYHAVIMLSGFINFWLARKFGRGLVIKFVGHNAMAKIDHISTHEGVKALFLMRFFQGQINDFISYAAGFTSIPFTSYYLISCLVPLFWTIALYLFFDLVPLTLFLSLSFGGGVLALFIPPLYYFLKHKLTKGKITHQD